MAVVKLMFRPLCLVFTTALGLYNVSYFLDRCCKRAITAIECSTQKAVVNASAEPSLEGRRDYEPGNATSSDRSFVHAAGQDDTELAETGFVDIEVGLRRCFISRLPTHSRKHEVTLEADELEQRLLKLAECDERFDQSHDWIAFTPTVLRIHVLDETCEQSRPCTPRVGLVSYPSSPDSGYYSQASPQSALGAKSPTRTSKELRPLSLVDMHEEMSEIETALSAWADCGRARNLSSRSAIPFNHFMGGHAEGVLLMHSITVLDRESGVCVSLRQALRTKAWRRRTGLLLSLYKSGEERELRTREAISMTELELLKATILIWDREDETFRDLATMLMTPESRLRASLCIEKFSTRSDRASTPKHAASWGNLLACLDLDAFYLSQMQDEGFKLHD